MERRAKVELFEEIRREHEFGIGTIKGVARKLGVHRRMVRQALANAQPPERRRTERERRGVGPLIPFINGILEVERKAPRNQRHTAHRIWQRIRTEMAERKVAEVTIRQYVRERKRELGWSTRAACVPQSYQPGQEGQVDWYEAWAELGGEPVLLQVFSMRSMASGAAFHRAYQRATQQAFLEAHEYAFSFFGGVFRLLRYDNLKAAVKKILRGFQREETTRFIAFRSHWRFQSEFCTPYEAHEKGGIESEAGYFRRNHWVPMPKARDLADLNAQLLAACREDERRQIAGHSQPVGTAMIEERAHLLPLAGHGLQLAWGSLRRGAGLCGGVPISIRPRPNPRRRSRYCSIRAPWKFGTQAAASRVTSAATNASNKFSTWNTISTCWSESRARSSDRSRSRRGGDAGCGGGGRREGVKSGFG